MRYIRLYQQWKRIVENVTDRESCLSKYGKILFGEQFGEDEKNTDLENHLIKLIKDFTGDKFGKDLSDELVNKLKELSKCLELYPSVLKPKNVDTFRGSEIKLVDLLKYEIDENLTISEFNYKPTYDISSWSTNFETAYKFASTPDFFDFDSTRTMGSLLNELFDTLNWTLWETENLKKQLESPIFYKMAKNFLNSNKNLSVVCICEKPNNTFLFNSENFSKLSNIPGEEEVLKITKDPIAVKLYLNTGNSLILDPLSQKNWEGKPTEGIKYPVVVDEKLKRCLSNAKLTFDKLKFILTNPSAVPNSNQNKDSEVDPFKWKRKKSWI